MATEATKKREIELTEYEAQRLNELATALAKGEEGLQQFVYLLRQLTESLREVRGRRAELLEMLGNKYEFDPGIPFSLGEDSKIILEREDAQLERPAIR